MTHSVEWDIKPLQAHTLVMLCASESQPVPTNPGARTRYTMHCEARRDLLALIMKCTVQHMCKQCFNNALVSMLAYYNQRQHT